MPTPLSELMKRCVAATGAAAIDAVGDDWMQGRSVFGGLQAAVALQAMRTLVPAVPLRTLQITFIAPVGATELRALARVLRTGKSATHIEARLGSESDTLAVAVGVFGSARDSIVRLDPPAANPPPATPPVQVPYRAGVWPNFIQQFDMALLAGALPFSGTHIDRIVYRLGLRDSGRTSEAHLLAFADLMPPVALSWMPGVVPGSSLTWMLEILDDGFTTQPLQGWRVDAVMSSARDGYTGQTTTIYAPDGKVVALSRQSMVVFG